MLFPPPAVIETEVFARLPDTYRRQGRQSEWLTAQLRGRDHHSLLEGPTFDRDGNLYVVDVPHGRVFRIAQDGTFALVRNTTESPTGSPCIATGACSWPTTSAGFCCWT
jgi:gluconolactonase